MQGAWVSFGFSLIHPLALFSQRLQSAYTSDQDGFANLKLLPGRPMETG